MKFISAEEGSHEQEIRIKSQSCSNWYINGIPYLKAENMTSSQISMEYFDHLLGQK